MFFTVVDIAKKLKCSCATVRNYCNALNVKRHGKMFLIDNNVVDIISKLLKKVGKPTCIELEARKNLKNLFKNGLT